MSNTTDDLIAMLDRVGDKQVRCPVCGNSDMGWNNGIHYVFPDWYYKPVALPLTGGMIVGDHDTEYTECPREVMEQEFGGHPAFLVCNRTQDHPDHKAHWWRIDTDDVKYDGALANHLINVAEHGSDD